MSYFPGIDLKHSRALPVAGLDLVFGIPQLPSALSVLASVTRVACSIALLETEPKIALAQPISLLHLKVSPGISTIGGTLRRGYESRLHLGKFVSMSYVKV